MWLVETDVRRYESIEDVREALDCGLLRLYGGSRPAHAGIAITNQPLLVELVLGMFHQVPEGPLLTTDVEVGKILRTGTVTWARIFEDDWITPIVDAEVGLTASNCDIKLSSLHVVAGGIVKLTTLAVGFPN